MSLVSQDRGGAIIGCRSSMHRVLEPSFDSQHAAIIQERT